MGILRMLSYHFSFKELNTLTGTPFEGEDRKGRAGRLYQIKKYQLGFFKHLADIGVRRVSPHIFSKDVVVAKHAGIVDIVNQYVKGKSSHPGVHFVSGSLIKSGDGTVTISLCYKNFEWSNSRYTLFTLESTGCFLRQKELEEEALLALCVGWVRMMLPARVLKKLEAMEPWNEYILKTSLSDPILDNKRLEAIRKYFRGKYGYDRRF